MSDKTGIEWTDATWNPIAGCSLVSPGCTNCYAMGVAHRFARTGTRIYDGLTTEVNGKPVWTGKINVNERVIDQPLRWKRPRRIFVNSMSDLFHEAVPDEVIDRVFAVMALAPQHTFQVLTKRPERMLEYLTARTGTFDIGHACGRVASIIEEMRRARGETIIVGPVDGSPGARWWPLPNVWLGVSVEDQRRADERIPLLLQTPAAVRFISAEPLLGAVNLHEYLLGFPAGHPASCQCGHGHGFSRCPNYGLVSQSCHKCDCKQFRKAHGGDGLHWVIAGGESGPAARPMHPDWARSLRDRCVAAGVPFFFKQWGEWLPWEESSPPEWYSQNGQREDHQILFPMDIADDPPGWDSGLSYIADGEEHAAFQRVDKKRAGHTLDGAVWQQMPGAI